MLLQEGDRPVRLTPSTTCVRGRAVRPRLVSEAVPLVHVEVLTVALTVQHARRAARWSRIDVKGNPRDQRDLDTSRLPLLPAAGDQVDLVARLLEHVAHG
jgi:hypothetical protein